MDNFTTKRKNTIKWGWPIKILAIVAFVLSVLSWFVSYEKFLKVWSDGLMFKTLPRIELTTKISLLLPAVACLLFIIYLFVFHDKKKAAILIPISFGTLALKILIDLFFDNSGFAVWKYIYLLTISACILAIIATINGFKDFKSKVFLIIFASVYLWCNLISIISIFELLPIFDYSIEKSFYIIKYTSPFNPIGSGVLCIALLLFGLKNNCPPIVTSSHSADYDKKETTNPEHALRRLKEKWELGELTEEEYKAQRAEIISKL